MTLSRRHIVWFTGSTCALAAGFILAGYLNGSLGSEPLGFTAIPGPAALSDGKPCIGEESSSVSDASERQPEVPILMPRHELASERSLEGIWVCGDEVVAVFESGVWLMMQPHEGTFSPTEENQQRLERYPGRYSLETIRGQEAQVADPEPPPGERPWGGGVRWVEGRWVYWIVGNYSGLSREQLVEIARTVAPA